ncbi:MAG: TldD/PmbA family protein [Gemmatimonadaceae bacterium]|nr:TldD/PmbA family protein [Gemmatimonadaceae bacterium]MCC6242213.1 TldD/PmbA family protein [Gemmatimonadaceae bacterium]
MTTRRDFMKQGGAALGASLFAGSALAGIPNLLSAAPAPSSHALDVFYNAADVKELMAAALTAAKTAGASYADVRVSRQRQNFVFTREQQIQQVVDTDTIGLGVRALVNGTWGFAATRILTTDGVATAAREAVAIAKASKVARDRAVEWLPSPVISDGVWKSAFTTDPFDISVEQKADLLLKANAAAMKAKGVQFVFSGFFFVKDERNYANTDGTNTKQDVVRSWPTMQITAVSADRTDFQNRTNVVAPAARGWEYILSSDLVGNAPKWGEEAVAKLTAKPVDVGRYDLVLDPANLWLTIHESIGHPTELDRAMGYEANYAGTSFIAPPEKMLGQLKYGPSIMNIQGDRSQVGGLSTIGWDDDGVKPDEFLIVKEGMFNDYQTTREQAPWLRSWYEKNGKPVRSHGCAYAQGWDNVQFQRMPNVSLLPGERDLSINDLVSATDRGILISGDGSFSIDQQRYNAQFGGQTFHEIKGGKIVGTLKDVAYQIRTPDFWNSLDMIGGKSSYTMGGSFFDGKGQPPQVNAVSHGSPPARFRNVNVINTGRKG